MKRKDERVKAGNNRRAMLLPGIQLIYLEEALPERKSITFYKTREKHP
jgi:hypothetical protein